GFMAFYPGPGIGGHCIPIDPWYLTYKAREHNYHTKLIETAGEINDDMPEYVVNKLVKILNNEKKAINGSNILVLGIAYKKDIDDLRQSPILNVLDQIEKLGGTWDIIDPNFESFIYNQQKVKLVRESEVNL